MVQIFCEALDSDTYKYMYDVPAAITNDHKPGGLKQKFILSQFWRLEV